MPFPLLPPQVAHYLRVRARKLQARLRGGRDFALVSRASHGSQIAPAASQPNPHLDAPGTHRRLGCPPAGGDRPADRQLQARERAARRGARRRGAPRPAHRRRDRPARGGRRAHRRRARGGRGERREAEEAEAAEAARLAGRQAERGDDEADAPKRRARRARGSAAARTRRGPLEGTFDHGEEGYGLWLDPAVADDPIYAEHWAGHRPVAVTIEEDQIVIRRSRVTRSPRAAPEHARTQRTGRPVAGVAQVAVERGVGHPLLPGAGSPGAVSTASAIVQALEPS